MAQFARNAVSVTKAVFDALVNGKVEVCDGCQVHQLKELMVVRGDDGAMFCSTDCADEAEHPDRR